MVAVYIPEYVPSHWWETLLHNQSALRLHVRLRQERGVIVVAVPLLMNHVNEDNKMSSLTS
jgi:hypothetical protein